jgi:hypothetical protein
LRGVAGARSPPPDSRIFSSEICEKAAVNEAKKLGRNAQEFAGHSDRRTTDKHCLDELIGQRFSPTCRQRIQSTLLTWMARTFGLVSVRHHSTAATRMVRLLVENRGRLPVPRPADWLEHSRTIGYADNARSLIAGLRVLGVVDKPGQSIKAW